MWISCVKFLLFAIFILKIKGIVYDYTRFPLKKKTLIYELNILLIVIFFHRGIVHLIRIKWVVKFILKYQKQHI